MGSLGPPSAFTALLLRSRPSFCVHGPPSAFTALLLRSRPCFCVHGAGPEVWARQSATGVKARA
eukprot:scaffold23132_cov62-Isochrysis_galbana.AAC.1